MRARDPLRAGRRVAGALLVAALSVALPSAAATKAPLGADAPAARDVDPRVLALMSEATFDEGIGEMSAAVLAGIDQGIGSVPGIHPASVARVRASAARAFDPERLRRSLALHLQDELDGASVERLLDHYRSPLGRRSIEAARTRKPDADRAAYERFTGAYGSTPEERVRLELFERMVTEAKFVDWMVRFTTDLQLASLYGVVSVVPEAADDPELDAMFDQVEAQGPVLRDMFEKMFPVHFAYVHEAFTTDELRELIAIGRLPEQRLLTDAYLEGMHEAFVGAAAEFVPRFVDAELLSQVRTEI